MMYESLNVKLAALPQETRVFFGHEYTESNLKFAAHLEPSNAAVAERAGRVAALRKSGQWTTPSTLAEEKLTNPFMRCDSEEIRRNMASSLSGKSDPATVLGAVRAAKDSF
jgi:hydroxyacylglutathione hydrolase